MIYKVYTTSAVDTALHPALVCDTDMADVATLAFNQTRKGLGKDAVAVILQDDKVTGIARGEK